MAVNQNINREAPKKNSRGFGRLAIISVIVVGLMGSVITYQVGHDIALQLNNQNGVQQSTLNQQPNQASSAFAPPPQNNSGTGGTLPSQGSANSSNNNNNSQTNPNQSSPSQNQNPFNQFGGRSRGQTNPFGGQSNQFNQAPQPMTRGS
ncbi:MAG TPA: hypothetical protein VH186_06390 [Chloroflexia bacterium]|nr:hypothetical protein [Chloroflexia bacterium]